MLDHAFWSGHFQRVFVPQIKSLHDALKDRLLPTFEKLQEEADSVEAAEWDRLMGLPSDGDFDPGDYAERAKEESSEYYELMIGVRQSIINMFAVASYHLWEQQLLTFHRRQILDPREENDQSLMKIAEAKNRLLSKGVNIESFSSYSQIDQMRLLTNTIKHADGHSADDLKAICPEYFHFPDALPDPPGVTPYIPPTYSPLAGRDVYLTLEQLESLVESLVTFWSELAEAISHDEPD